MTDYFVSLIGGILILLVIANSINMAERGEKYADELQEKHQIEIQKCEEKGGQAITKISEPHYGLFVEELQACIDKRKD